MGTWFLFAFVFALIDDKIKNTAWKHIDFCGHYGSCGGGKRKVVFGKEFSEVCSYTFRIDKEKQTAINKVAALLKDGGKFVLSIDKNQDEFIEYGTRKITVFPDTPDEIKTYIKNSGLLLTKQYETEFSHIFAAKKNYEIGILLWYVIFFIQQRIITEHCQNLSRNTRKKMYATLWKWV